MNTPLLFLIFNRPGSTARVFDEIRKARPARLFVAADGPRRNRPGESELCLQTRNIIASVDWPCEVKTLFREENLGCRNAVSGGINWFFSEVEEGIILEDDCLPHQHFFVYCETLLERYRGDERIAHIGGVNFQHGKRRGDGDYYFSNLSKVWGWASWRRAWQYYDVTMKDWPQFEKDDRLSLIFKHRKIASYFRRVFELTYEGKIDTWDYQLLFSNLRRGAISVTPNINLVSNIGFGADGTHTLTAGPNANLAVFAMESFNPPSTVSVSNDADAYEMRNITDFVHKLKQKLLTIFKR